MVRFRNNDCIAFSRKWTTTDINQHFDSAGRDDYGHNAGKVSDVGHEVGNKPYKYPAQCIFFGKMKDTAGKLTVTNLCTTVQDWLLDAIGAPATCCITHTTRLKISRYVLTPYNHR